MSPSLPLTLLLLSLLLNSSLLIQASPSPQTTHLRTLQTELANSARASLCNKRRLRNITRARNALSKARKCRYASLSVSDYLHNRRICKNRSEARHAFYKCNDNNAIVLKCQHQKRALDIAVSACDKIGWDGSGIRANCPSVQEAKQDLAVAEANQCPPIGRPIETIRAEIDVAAEQVRIALNLPSPAYRSRVLEPANYNPDAVVFLLHGVGGDGVREVQNARILKKTRMLPGVRFVIPLANPQFVTFFNDTRPSWFDILSDEVDGPQAMEQVIQAASNINDLMRIQELVYGISPRRIMIMGTSQGGALATTVYLRYRVGAVVSFSGYIPIADTYPAALSDASEKSPFLMFHGTEDDVVPFNIAETTAKILTALGRRIKFIILPGEMHVYSSATWDRVLPRSARFIARRLRP